MGISFYNSIAVFLIIIFLSPPEPEVYERNDRTEVIIKLVSVLEEVIKALECKPNNSGVSSLGNFYKIKVIKSLTY